MKGLRTGVIPAAGRGNRISELPLTRILPKPMLPVLERPILEYVVENMRKLGVEIIYLIVGYKKEAIEEYFGDGTDWGVRIEYIEQKQISGIAGAIGLVEKFVEGPFIVILGDDLTVTASLDDLLATFLNKDVWAVEGVVEEENIEVLKRTCCVSMGENRKMLDIEEKPTKPKTNLRGIGIYIFDQMVFDFIRKTPVLPPRNEIEITNTLALIARENRAYCSKINGVNVNINTLDDLIRASALISRFKHGVDL